MSSCNRNYVCDKCGDGHTVTDMRLNPYHHEGCGGHYKQISGPQYPKRRPLNRRKKRAKLMATEKELTDAKAKLMATEKELMDAKAKIVATEKELTDAKNLITEKELKNAKARITELEEQRAEEVCPNCGFNHSDMADVADMDTFAKEVESDIHHKGD